MRKVIAHLFSSVDGVVESPHLFQFDRFGEAEGAAMDRLMSGSTDAIMGRVIYEQWAAYWPGKDDPDDFGAIINPMAKHVASTTLSGPLSWENSRLIEGELVEYVRRLAAQPGGVINVSGISVIRQLLAAGVLDELTLTIHPASGGTGARLFDGLSEPVRLELVDGQVTPVGNAIMTYRPLR